MATLNNTALTLNVTESSAKEKVANQEAMTNAMKQGMKVVNQWQDFPINEVEEGPNTRYGEGASDAMKAEVDASAEVKESLGVVEASILRDGQLRPVYAYRVKGKKKLQLLDGAQRFRILLRNQARLPEGRKGKIWLVEVEAPVSRTQMVRWQMTLNAEAQRVKTPWGSEMETLTLLIADLGEAEGKSAMAESSGNEKKAASYARDLNEWRALRKSPALRHAAIVGLLTQTSLRDYFLHVGPDGKQELFYTDCTLEMEDGSQRKYKSEEVVELLLETAKEVALEPAVRTTKEGKEVEVKNRTKGNASRLEPRIMREAVTRLGFEFADPDKAEAPVKPPSGKRTKGADASTNNAPPPSTTALPIAKQLQKKPSRDTVEALLTAYVRSVLWASTDEDIGYEAAKYLTGKLYEPLAKRIIENRNAASVKAAIDAAKDAQE